MRIKVLLLFGLMLLFSDCQKEASNPLENTNIESKHQHGKMTLLSAEDIPEIFSKASNQSSNHQNLVDNVNGVNLPFRIKEIIQEGVMEVYDDEKDIYTYSFKVIMEKDHPNSFFNVVVYKSGNGINSDAYIIKYQMDKRFAKKYYAGEARMVDFEGKIKRFKLKEAKGINNTKALPCPCEEVDFSGGGGSTGDDVGDGNSSNSGSGGGSTTICTTIIMEVSCTGPPRHSPGDPDCQCGKSAPCTAAYTITDTNCFTNENLYNDCPDVCDPSGSTGINEPPVDYDGSDGSNASELEIAAEEFATAIAAQGKHNWSVDQLRNDPWFKNHITSFITIPKGINNQEWQIIAAEAYVVAYKKFLNTSAGSTINHKDAYLRTFDEGWWDQIKNLAKEVEEMYDRVVQFLPQTADEWTSVGAMMSEQLFEVALGLNPIAGAALSMRDALEEFENGSVLAGSFFVALAAAEFVPWPKVGKAVINIGEAGYKSFKLYKAWKVLSGNAILRKGVANLDQINNYLTSFSGSSTMLTRLFQSAGGNGNLFLGTINKLSKITDRVVLDGASLGLDNATIDAVRWLTPKPGYFDVILHGTPDEFMVKVASGEWVSINHRTLVNFMKNRGYSGGKVRLVSCNTGVFPDAVGQHLSNKLGVEVLAPRGTVTVFSNGSTQVFGYSINNSSSWRNFNPGG